MTEMTTREAPRRTKADRRRGMASAAGLALLLTLFVGGYPEARSAPDRPTPLRIANPTFQRGPDSDHPVDRWQFLERVPGAACVRNPANDGAILMATSEIARGDLLSRPLRLKPWRDVDVTIEYETLFGEPVVFVGVRPYLNRVLVDQDFVPMLPPGRKSKGTVHLHAGLTEGDYAVQVSICGRGVAKITSIEATKGGFYKRPEHPAFVLDILNTKCPPDHTLRWTAIDKLRTVYGFPEIISRHYSEFSKEDLTAAKPGLLLISGTGGVGKDRPKVLDVIRVLWDYPAPLVGICGGHQYMALAKASGKLGKLKVKAVGPTRIEIVRDDPIFEGLPRRPLFIARENHNYYVTRAPPGTKILAQSETGEIEALRYTRKPWYTFQCHIEANWHLSCVEAPVIWKNLLRKFKLIE